MKYDFNKCTKETLVALAEASHGVKPTEVYIKALDAVQREAMIKLRNRAEVDADIAKVIREYHNEFDCNTAVCFDSLKSFRDSKDKINKLCKEETQG
jgi:wyosine [tRNA(Phe)-imidazoG37] synthetase (radical SAM superfamily)